MTDREREKIALFVFELEERTFSHMERGRSPAFSRLHQDGYADTISHKIRTNP